MTRLTSLVLAFASCARPAPLPPTATPNGAVQYARTLNAKAACLPLSTGVRGQPDTAVCDIARVMAYCWAGEGAGSECVGFADMRPKPPAAPAIVTDKPASEVTDADKRSK